METLCTEAGIIKTLLNTYSVAPYPLHIWGTEGSAAPLSTSSQLWLVAVSVPASCFRNSPFSS